MNVLPPGTTPFLIEIEKDEDGDTKTVRAHSLETAEFLWQRTKREMMAAKAIIPPHPDRLKAAGPAVEGAFTRYAARKTEIQEKQKQLPDLLKAIQDRSAYLSAAEIEEFRKLHEDCKDLLAKTSGQAPVTAFEQETALSRFTALEAKATELQKNAGLAELTTLMEEVIKLDQDIDPDAHVSFQTLHEQCRVQFDAMSKDVPLAADDRTKANTALDGTRDRAEELQQQAEVTRRNKTARTALFGRAKVAIPLAFKPFKGSPTADHVLDALEFDKEELARLGGGMADALAVLQKEKRPTTEHVGDMRTKLELLESRVTESRGFLNNILPRTPSELEKSTDVNLVNSAMRRDWGNFVKEAGKLDRNLDGCRKLITSIRAEIDRKTPISDEDLLKLLNHADRKRPLKEIPKALLEAAGNNRVVLKQCLEIEWREAVLERLLKLADVPRRLPGLLDTARKPPLNLNSAQVEEVLRTYKGSTADAEKLFTNIDVKLQNTGNDATWFLSGAGGQTLSDLARLLRHGDARIWTGDTCPAPKYGPLAGPAVAFAHITNYAVPMVGASRPPPGGYAGNRSYGNGGIAPDMALPSRTVDNQEITYREYDIRPYYPGVNRGAERVVVGSDGRKYYTTDHYHSFRLIP
ncbi:MAG: ribonuclease domain-containing protein [Pseudonocardiaceae bacterium]